MIKYLLVLLCLISPYAHALDDFADDEGLESEMQEDDGSFVPDARANPDADTEPRAPASDVVDAPPADAPPANAPPPEEPPAPTYPYEERREPIVAEPERPSSTPGEKIFDWDKHRGERQVKHPFAEKGLVRITRDKTYLYKVSESEQNRAADFHVGVFNPSALSNPDSDGAYSTYEDNYRGGAPAILANYEWQMWRSPIGKLGLRAGGGLFVSQGNGHFVHTNDLKPLEVFTFAAIPASFGGVYRMQLWNRQMLVPYAEGGGTVWGFAELRDDDKKPKFGGALAAYAAAGVALNLTYFNALSKVALDREYGINSVYLLAEFRGIVGLSKNYDFTASLLNGGLLMEF